MNEYTISNVTELILDSVSTNTLIINSDENRNLIQSGDKCDKYDYLIAVACGAIGGMIDIFLVGAPGDSVLGNGRMHRLIMQ